MRRVLHADACNRAHANLLIVILITKVYDLDFITVDPKCYPSVLGAEQAAGALPVAGQRIGVPARHRAHLLEEGNDSLHLGDHGGLQPVDIVILDELPQPLMDHVSDFHAAI
jgi:hypothetical protein